MKLNIAVELPDDADPELVDGYCVAVTAIARQLFPPVWVRIDGGGISESVRGNGPADNSVSVDPDRNLPLFYPDSRVHLRAERGVDRVRSASDRRDFGDPGPRPGIAAPVGAGVHGLTGSLESALEPLTGPPRGPLEEGTEEQMHRGSHRGRRRRLLDTLKRVSAGTRFRR